MECRRSVLLDALLLGFFLISTCLSSCKGGSEAPSQSGAQSQTTTAPPTATHSQAAQTTSPPTQGAEEFASEQETAGVLALPDGSRFQTSVYGMKVIGQLSTIHKLPYYILSGRGCYDCDANVSIYIHSPSDGEMKGEAERRFYYPGHETYYEDGSPLYEARMFFGDCAPGHPNAALWFQRFFDDGQWRPSVFVAAVKADQLSMDDLRENAPTIKDAEVSVKRGVCQEVPGIDRTSEP